jgi:hypothetical protein
MTGRESSPSSQMNIRIYLDREVDAARVVVSDERIARTVRVKGFGFVDLDADDNVVAVELFKVSEQIQALNGGVDEPERDLDEELRASATRLVNQAKERVKTA